MEKTSVTIEFEKLCLAKGLEDLSMTADSTPRNVRYTSELVNLMWECYLKAHVSTLMGNFGHYVLAKMTDNGPTFSDRPARHWKLKYAHKELHRLCGEHPTESFAIYQLLKLVKPKVKA